jgi:FMN phosphatase YigB (HAD superfamily)
MGIKQGLYSVLLDRKPVIRQKYERFLVSEKGSKSGKLGKFAHLAGLNFSYYILRDRAVSVMPASVNESSIPKLTTDELAAELLKFDTVSFDVFDTLIYRYTAKPSDVFCFTETAKKCNDFANLRIQAEIEARKEKARLGSSTEVTLEEIADKLSKMTGIDKNELVAAEYEAELDFCHASPYMKRVWDILRKKGCHPVILSDMYLDSEQIKGLLENCCYDVSDIEIIVSCDVHKSKYEGSAYKLLKQLKKKSRTFAHVGDNELSDIKNAEKAHITAFRCVNPDKKGSLYREVDITPEVKSIWTGLVNKKMYRDTVHYDKYYELGYNDLGIIACGYADYKRQKDCEVGFGGEGAASMSSLFGEKGAECYIECDIENENIRLITKLFKENNAVSEGVFSFISDYDKLRKKYGSFLGISQADAKKVFDYLLYSEEYLDNLK